MILDEWLTAFALDKNLQWIFETKVSNDDISTVHGMRFMNAIMLLLSHKSMAMFFNPYNNRTEMSEVRYIFLPLFYPNTLFYHITILYIIEFRSFLDCDWKSCIPLYRSFSVI